MWLRICWTSETPPYLRWHQFVHGWKQFCDRGDLECRSCCYDYLTECHLGLSLAPGHLGTKAWTNWSFSPRLYMGERINGWTALQTADVSLPPFMSIPWSTRKDESDTSMAKDQMARQAARLHVESLPFPRNKKGPDGMMDPVRLQNHHLTDLGMPS